MQTPLVGVADIHAGTFPDRFETLEFVDLSGVIFLIFADPGGTFGRSCGGGGFFFGLEHKLAIDPRAENIAEERVADKYYLRIKMPGLPLDLVGRKGIDRTI
jgi:hypothetical protein